MNTNHRDVSKYFKVLSNPVRLSIFMKIFETCCSDCMEKESVSPNCVTRISKSLDLPQPTVSNHVKALVSNGLVDSKRKGKNIYLFPSTTFKDIIEYFSKYIASKEV